jgi:hypothetical protein
MGGPFKLIPFVIQELFLLLLLLSTFVYLDELFVSKGLDREVIMYTGGEKLMNRIITSLVWIVLATHVGWLALSLFKKKSVLRKVIFKA